MRIRIVYDWDGNPFEYRLQAKKKFWSFIPYWSTVDAIKHHMFNRNITLYDWKQKYAIKETV